MGLFHQNIKTGMLALCCLSWLGFTPLLHANDGSVTLSQHCNYGGYAVQLGPGRYNLRQLEQLGVRNDDLSSLRVSRGYEVVMYEHDQFRGKNKTFSTDIGCLVNEQFNDVVSSVIVRKLEGVENAVRQLQQEQAQRSSALRVYEHCDYGGYEIGLSEGRYSLSQLQSLGVRNDDLSSLRVSSGYEVVVYEHTDYQGASRTFRRNDKCLVNNNFNDVISSLIVRRIPPPASPVTVYQHCDFGGYGVSLGEGRYTLSELASRGVRNDDLSSIRVPNGMLAVLYEHDHFRGRSISISSNSSCFVQQGFNDIVSSVVIRKR